MTTITIQPGQPGKGMEYDVHKPLPYPFHIDVDSGDCRHGRGAELDVDLARQQPWRLIGFQCDAETQEVCLSQEAFFHDPTRAVGMFPVFIHEGSIFNLDVPITNVTVHGSTVTSGDDR